ncbi:uncharacterized protein LOC110025193 [Phalaenopsis equestris]|uniref:uncharacterized protein LOC110025193 n=1 Tax=Phalaenopsis equestris TaxID=78828 RepID=UPI0009E4A453|nr:uncharacterized protein LOC110025193 [Phalaenopsis equestris]
MVWRKFYLDLILIPLTFLLFLIYHTWLWHKFKANPRCTDIGMSSIGRRFWVLSVIKDNEKKSIMAVQTLRNAIMGETLMASASVLICTGLAAVLSSNYIMKKPMENKVLGAHGEWVLAIKFTIILLFFLLAFFSYSLSVRFMNQVGFLINADGESDGERCMDLVEPDYVVGLLEKSYVLSIMGNRLFYLGLPLLLWVFGPLLVFACAVIMISVFYKFDVVESKGDRVRSCRI